MSSNSAAVELPAPRSEILELARLMERYPEETFTRDIGTEQEPYYFAGIAPGDPEWGLIIACLRIAAAA